MFPIQYHVFCRWFEKEIGITLVNFNQAFPRLNVSMVTETEISEFTVIVWSKLRYGAKSTYNYMNDDFSGVSSTPLM